MDLSSTILSYLAGVSTRSLCLLALALSAIWVGRVRSASARHAVWSLVAAGMLLLAALNPLLPAIPVRVLQSSSADLSAVAIPEPTPVSLQAGGAMVAPSGAPRWIPSWTQALFALYLAGALFFIVRFLFGYVFTRRLVRASRPIDRELPLDGAALLESSWISAPMTVGCLRPKVLLPPDWRDWDQAKLHAVLAHELTHVRRADWMVAALARLNRSLFWFHPLAWWLERRLAVLAEQACDDSALLVLGDRAQYASALLDMAAAVRSKRGRLVWQAIAMAEPAEVGSRIDRILDETRQIPRALTRSRRLVMVACSAPLLYMASALQLAPTRALGQEARVESPYLRSLIAGTQITPADVISLEQSLETNPGDLAVRGKLIAYYFMNGVREPRLKHILWLIENHPESELAGFASAGITPRATGLNDEADYERARALWRRQTAQYAGDTRILGNAVQFYLQPGGDFDEAERLLKSARALDPKLTAWTDRLATLYTRVILGTAIGNGSGSLRGMVNPGFAEKVRAELENSTDGPLLAAAGSQLASAAKGLRQAPNSNDSQLNSVSDLGDRLVQRSGQLGVGRPATRLAPATPVRLRIGGNVQATKLQDKVTPVYPRLAKQERIEGVVRFNVTISADGHVNDLQLVEGHPLLTPAAQDAVSQWVYRPTLLNGEPVEVLTVVDVNFTLSR